MWYILGCLFCKAEHSVKGLISELAAHQFMIAVCIRCIQTDGDGIYQTFQFRRHISFPDQIRQTIRIDTNRLPIVFFYKLCDLQKGIQTFGWFPVSAENHFFILRHIEFRKFCFHFFHGRLMLQPQSLVIMGNCIHILTQAEGTGTWTTIGQIHIKIIVYLV